MNIIEIENLTKRYGDFTAVNNISFSVDEGEFVGFLGVNGAGKSTTINMMSTLLASDGGNIKICGYNLKQSEEIRKNIGIVYQENVLDDLLTVNENLVCRGVLHGISKAEVKKKISQLGRLFGIDEILNKKYKFLSGGQKRKCEIAAALMHTPKILFLDEPTTGLDPASRIEVWNTVKSMRQSSNMTVFLTTHYMEEAAEADKIIIIDKGALIAQGTPNELKEQYAYDYLKIYSDKNIADKLTEFDFRIHNNCTVIKLHNTIEAIEILNRLQKDITAFEVVQGTLDDVFINVTAARQKMTAGDEK